MIKSDLNSNGLDIELSCFHDTSVAATHYDECFTESGDRRLIYTSFEDINGDEYERTYKVDCNAKEIFRKYQRYTKEEVRYLLNELDTYVYAKPLRKCTVEDMLEAIKNHCYSREEYDEFMGDAFEPDFHIYTSKGWCQSDWRDVLIPKELLEITGARSYETFYDEIDNLLWDTPVYCRIEIDCEEYDLMEDFGPYEYDKETIIAHADKSILAKFHPLIRAYVKEFLEKYLPEYPRYI